MIKSHIFYTFFVSIYLMKGHATKYRNNLNNLMTGSFKIFRKLQNTLVHTEGRQHQGTNMQILRGGYRINTS